MKSLLQYRKNIGRNLGLPLITSRLWTVWLTETNLGPTWTRLLPVTLICEGEEALAISIILSSMMTTSEPELARPNPDSASLSGHISTRVKTQTQRWRTKLKFILPTTTLGVVREVTNFVRVSSTCDKHNLRSSCSGYDYWLDRTLWYFAFVCTGHTAYSQCFVYYFRRQRDVTYQWRYNFRYLLFRFFSF